MVVVEVLLRGGGLGDDDWFVVVVGGGGGVGVEGVCGTIVLAVEEVLEELVVELALLSLFKSSSISLSLMLRK